MKKLILFTLSSLFAFSAFAQGLHGAWQRIATQEDGRKVRNTVIFADGFQVATWYDAATGAFISCNGGTWSLKDNMLTEGVEFDTKNPDRVGSEASFEIVLAENKLMLAGTDRIWTRVDDGTPGALAGAWLISGRMRDGEIQRRDTDRPRKTMKILSGTRFQWIAYNVETHEFKGTGGGTYTTLDGKYTENIEFFSKDDSRVGASLQFDYELRDGDWHHSGLSSKGTEIYEVWSVRE